MFLIYLEYVPKRPLQKKFYSIYYNIRYVYYIFRVIFFSERMFWNVALE